MTRARLNVFLEVEHARQIEELAVVKRLSKSSIIAAALAAFLSPESAERREAALTKRLDRLSRQFDKLERDQNILIETVALYVRYYLSVTLPVAEGQQEAARAHGRARFEQFVQQLGRHLQRGNSLVREVHEEIFPEEPHPAAPSPNPSATPTASVAP